MGLIRKWRSGEYMPESQLRVFQLQVGKTRKALADGKTVDEIAEILRTDIITAKEYVAFVEETMKMASDLNKEFDK